MTLMIESSQVFASLSRQPGWSVRCNAWHVSSLVDLILSIPRDQVFIGTPPYSGLQTETYDNGPGSLLRFFPDHFLCSTKHSSVQLKRVLTQYYRPAY